MNIDEIYLEIAYAIIDAIKSKWAIAIVDCKLAENTGDFKCTYKEDIDSDVDVDCSFEMFTAFESLHKMTTEGGKNKWNRAKFTLYPTGKYSIDFE